jgi:Flp pilus assembly protein TadG
MMHRPFSWLRRLAGSLRDMTGDRRGAAMLEFAVACPVFVVLLVGGVDLSRLVILNQKLDRVASGMGELVAQADEMTQTQMTQLFQATSHVAAPFDFARDGSVIITSMSVIAGAPRINWQSQGGGSLTSTSRLGTGANAVVTLPAGLTVTGTETLIAAEVFFDFEPMFGLGLVPGAQLYHRSFFRPRVGSLKTLAGG